MISDRTALFFVVCCLGVAGFHLPGALAQDAKVDVCHIPPGNPDNAHTITISENAVATHLEHGDHLGPCASAPTLEVREPGSPSPAPSACICPKAGVWRVTNLEGWMECKPFGIKRKDSRADVIMDRGRDCLFFGTAPGVEEGAEVIFDGAYKVENEEFITGEYHMEMSGMGVSKLDVRLVRQCR